MGIYLDKNARMQRLAHQQEKVSGKVALVSDESQESENIVEVIRENYSLTKEVAILRKALAKLISLTGADKTEFYEFLVYNETAENAKVQVRNASENE